MEKFDFNKIRSRFQRVKVDLPRIIANSCQLYFNNEFNRSEWNGKSWNPRKNRKNTKHLLVDTGALRIALNNCVKNVSWSKVTLAIDLPYAEYQNYGTEHIPARKFIGDSPELRRTVKAKITREMKKVFKH